MNIVLIGYRGTGKSAVGEILAVSLGMKYVGMDAEIVKRAGMSIPRIVEKYGGRIELLPLRPGVSTSAIIDSIRDPSRKKDVFSP